MDMNPFDLLKNAQKLQAQMSSLQEKLDTITATGASGGGMVEIEFNGKLEAISVHISPEAVEDIEMLQDLIMAALTDGMAKIKEAIGSETAGMAGGFNLKDFMGGF